MTKVGISIIALAALVWLAPVGAHADESKEKLKGHKQRIEKPTKHNKIKHRGRRTKNKNKDHKTAHRGLQQQIDTEVQDRKTGDSELQQQIEGLEAGGTNGSCPVGMVPVGPLCVDKYEASVWSSSDEKGIQFGEESDDYPCNSNGNNCKDQIYAQSLPDVLPSRFITWFLAQQACANSGKRLLTNAEWQMAAAGTPDSDACNVSTGVPMISNPDSTCFSNWGVHDMVGNVWEWVADWIQGSQPDDTSSSSAAYGNDLIGGINDAQLQGEGAEFSPALRRGGSFRQGPDAGVFALDARVAPSFENDAIGFRCGR